jgi:hypothetical protein
MLIRGVTTEGRQAIQGGPAPRFKFQLPLLYRISGQTHWHEGTTDNISRSGVLFRGQQSLKPQTSVEISFVISLKNPDGASTKIAYSGRIVRSLRTSGGEPLSSLAAAFSGYRLVRGDDKTGDA